MSRRELVSKSSPLHLAVDLDFLSTSRRGIRKPDVVVSRYEKTGGAGCRVVDGFTDLWVNDFDDGADNMPWCAELAELASLLDLLEDMLEEVSFVSASARSRRKPSTNVTTCVSTVGSSMTRRAPCMKLVAEPLAMSAKNGNTSSRTKRTSGSPERPFAQTDHRNRSFGIVVSFLAGAFKGFFSAHVPRKVLCISVS